MTTIRVTHLPPMYQDPAFLPRVVREGAITGLMEAGARGRTIVSGAIRTADPRPPIDTGLMVGGQLWEIQNDILTVRLGPSPAVLTRTVAMEKGRRPGKMPPPAALARWARRKRLATNDADAEAAGFAIARSIAKKGIRARRFYAKSVPALRAMARKVVAGRVVEAIRRAFQRPGGPGGSPTGSAA